MIKNKFTLINFWAIVVPFAVFFHSKSNAQTTIDFDNTSDLTTHFTPSSGAVFTNVSDEGLLNSGCVHAVANEENWISKAGELAVIGNQYTVSAFVQLYSSGGRPGIGFTTDSSGTIGLWGHPTNGLGMSFHGNGGEFIDNGNSTFVLWKNDVVNLNWYYVEFTIDYKDSNSFDLHFSLYNADSTGTIGTLDSSHHLSDLSNSKMDSATTLYPYFCHNTNRLRRLDDFSYEVTNPCNKSVSPSALVLCPGGRGNITIASSTIGVDYYLRNDSSSAIVSGPVAGNGSSIILKTEYLSDSTTYNVWSTTGLTGAMEFNGTSKQYVNLGDSIDLANKSFTIELWARADSTVNLRHFFSHGNRTNNNGLHARIQSNSLFMGFWGNDFTSSGTFPVDSLWHHYAFSFDTASKKRTIYADGIAVASQISGSNYLGAGEFLIGDFVQGTNGGYGSWIGGIDNFRIWNNARTDSEIVNNMNSCLKGDESGLIALYQFEDGAGSNSVSDLTGNGHDGVLNNIDSTSNWISGVSCFMCDSFQMWDKVTVTLDSSKCAPIGSIEDDLGNGIQVFPNPSNGIFTIESRTSPIQKIYLFNSVGQEIEHVIHDLNTIDLCEFPNGIYYLHIQTINRIEKIKIVKG